MSLSKSQIQHIANLARLKITDDEVVKYSAELSKVLDYVDQLKEVDIAEMEPTAQVSGLTNRWRTDKAIAWDEAEKEAALRQAEVVENNLVKVPKII